MNKKQQKHIITLSSQHQQSLQAIIHKGKRNARVILRARVLLASAKGLTDKDIGKKEGVHWTTVERIRVRFHQGGLDRALYDAKRTGQPRKLDDKAEAHLVALACSDPPEGRERWTLELLQKKMIADKKVSSISDVCILTYLKGRGIKPWREKNVVRPNTHSGVH